MVFIVSLQTKNDTLRINILIDIQTTLRKGTIPILFIWTTDYHLGKCISEVIPAWGFEYKTIGFVWAKKIAKNR